MCTTKFAEEPFLVSLVVCFSAWHLTFLCCCLMALAVLGFFSMQEWENLFWNYWTGTVGISFTVRVVKHWHRWPQEIVKFLSLDVVNTQMDAACCSWPCLSRGVGFVKLKADCNTSVPGICHVTFQKDFGDFLELVVIGLTWIPPAFCTVYGQ